MPTFFHQRLYLTVSLHAEYLFHHLLIIYAKGEQLEHRPFLLRWRMILIGRFWKLVKFLCNLKVNIASLKYISLVTSTMTTILVKMATHHKSFPIEGSGD